MSGIPGTNIRRYMAFAVVALLLNSPAIAFIPAPASALLSHEVAELRADVWFDAAEMPYLGDPGTVLASLAADTDAGRPLDAAAAPDWQRPVDRDLRRDTRNSLGLFVFLTEVEISGAYLDAARVELAQQLDLRPEQFMRVEELSPLVQRMAERFQLSPELLMAMIHTESTFKADAESHANAYGLMQIVPKYAGRAARKALTGKAQRPSVEELLQPEVNVELGSAYLTVLQQRYFSHINDETVRDLAVVAAYNWGPGRVRTAIKRFGREPSAEEFVALMIDKAPRETSDYVQRVARRAGIYRGWFDHVGKNDFEQPIYALVWDMTDDVETSETIDGVPVEGAPEQVDDTASEDAVVAML